MIALTQLSFTFGILSYITVSFQSIIFTFTGVKAWIWSIVLIMWSILIPIAWVRNISKFSFTFLIGNLCIISTVIIVSLYLSQDLYHNGLGPNLQPINHDGYWSMVGFSCFVYEGIGIVMPIMNNCECPEKFDKILLYAILTLTVVYCFFGELCCLVLGSNLD